MYIVVLAVLLLGALVEPGFCYVAFMKKRDITEIFFLVTCIALMLIAAFRVNIGRDYDTYTSSLVYLHKGSSLSWLNYEPGFMLLCKLLAPFTKNGHIIIIVTSIITMGLVYVSIKKYSVNAFQSLFLYYSLYLFCNSLNLVRQFIAIGIILVSLNAIMNQQLFKSMLCIGIAAMFHSSALLCIPFFFFQKIKMSKRVIISISLVAAFIAFFYEYIIRIVAILLPKYARYLEGAGSSSYFNILILALSLIMLLYIKEYSLYGVADDKMLNFFISATVFCMIITAFTVKIVYFARASFYFFAISIFSIPYCWNQTKGRIEQYVFKAVIIVAAIILFLHLLNANTGTIAPYQLWDFRAL